jgi:hypothetical protein
MTVSAYCGNILGALKECCLLSDKQGAMLHPVMSLAKDLSEWVGDNLHNHGQARGPTHKWTHPRDNYLPQQVIYFPLPPALACLHCGTYAWIPSQGGLSAPPRDTVPCSVSCCQPAVDSTFPGPGSGANRLAGRRAPSSCGSAPRWSCGIRPTVSVGADLSIGNGAG